MQIYRNASLKGYHTFSIDQSADVIAEVTSIDDVKRVYLQNEWRTLPKLILGKGSNVLFTQPYRGVVLINRLMGLEISEDDECYYLRVSGGEDWPQLVESMVKRGIGGLENLAMIPGCVGSAPVQNIGAYGLEFKDVCEYVEYFDNESLELIQLTGDECQFGYRDSIFKHALKEKAFVTAVGIRLPKDYQPLLSYGPLQSLPFGCTCRDIFDLITQVRTEKLPDPVVSGNAGSFFKNPVISEEQFYSLQEQYPNIVHYVTDSGIKLAAGWLIDQCGLKGLSIGGAQVHPKQALVLVNQHHACSEDVVKLALHVRQCVYERYGVMLEHEVRFIGELEEVYLDNFMDK